MSFPPLPISTPPFRYLLYPRQPLTIIRVTDPRRSNLILHDPRRPPSSSPNRPTSRPPFSFGNPKVHSRHRRRRLPILPHPRQQHECQQPHGQSRCRRWFPYPGAADEFRRCWRWRSWKGSGERWSVGNSETGVWRWWTRRKSESHGVDDGGFGNGGGGVWG